MRCLAVTLPEFFAAEGELLAAMLASGIIDRVHIRKPGADVRAVERLVAQVPVELRARLSLHDHHELAALYGTGVHLNARNPVAPDGFSGTVSRSCHTLDETRQPADYCFLSPIYNSISKHGYAAAFDLDTLRGRVDSRIVALGGVTPDRLPELARVGFGGAAFLGYLWHGNVIENLNQINKYKSCCNS